MNVEHLNDLKEIVSTIGHNYNYVEIDGIWDRKFTCIFCRSSSVNSISSIEHDNGCVSKRLIQLYDILDDEIYKMEEL